MNRDRILIADLDGENQRRLYRALEGYYELVMVQGGKEALAALAHAPAPPVVIVGRRLADMDGSELVRAVRQRNGQGRLVLFVATSAGDEENDELGGESDVYYVLNRQVSDQDVRALVDSAIARQAVGSAPLATAGEATRLRRILDMTRLLASQRDLQDLSRVAVGAALELCGADRAYCLFYDSASGALWSEKTGRGRRDSRAFDGSAARGIAGFVARTGRAIALERADRDPRYAPRVDDPRGKGDERLVAQPVAGMDRQIHAVLVAVRRAAKPPFSEAERRLLASLAEQSGPVFHQLALDVEAASVLEEAAGGERQELFRREAVEAYRAHQEHGDVVRISPAWVRRSFWVIVAALIAAAVYLALGRVTTYSTGPAVVQLAGRTILTAKIPGTIATTHVTPGAHVTQGQTLVRFYDAEEVAELERMEREFELKLVEFLRNPSDRTAGAQLATLRAQKERAQALLEERRLRAPHDGTVSDIHVRPGQYLQPGDVVLSLVGRERDLRAIAFLPGSDRPQLAAGMTLRLELSGYRYAYQPVTIDSVSEEVIGPAAARRYLSSQVADSVPITGPVVFVTARLPSPTFEADGQTYHYHDGMVALAEVSIRSERIITALIPGLKGL